jgi:hypothetical protein
MTMTDKTYNGWTNYETWRVNLEIFDNLALSEFDGINDKVDPELICVHTLAEALQERAEYYIECESKEGLARDYALAFLSAVNWHEIAKHMVDDYILDQQN